MPKDTIYLTCDRNVCRKCGQCERLLRGFKTSHGGCLAISRRDYQLDEQTFYSVQSMIEACPAGAIALSG